MSKKPVDVRIVPHHGEWAVKLTGGFGNKPIEVTQSRKIALETATWVAIRNEVPLLEYDENGSFMQCTPWKEL